MRNGKALLSALLLLSIFPAIASIPVKGQGYTTLTTQFTTSFYSYSTYFNYYTQTLTTSWSSTETATFSWATAPGVGALCLVATMPVSVPVTQQMHLQVIASVPVSIYLLSPADLSKWINFIASMSVLNLPFNPCVPTSSVLSADLKPSIPTSFDTTLPASTDKYSLFFISRLRARVMVEVNSLIPETVAVTQTMQLIVSQTLAATYTSSMALQLPIQLPLDPLSLLTLTMVVVAALVVVELFLHTRPQPRRRKRSRRR